MLDARHRGGARRNTAGGAPRLPIGAGRERRGATVRDQRNQVLPDGHHARRHPHVDVPGANGDPPAGVDDQRRRSQHQRIDHPAFRVVAAVRISHLEAAVERRHQRHRLGGLYGRGIPVGSAARTLRTRVEPGRQQRGVHPRDPGEPRAARRDQRRLVYRGHAIDAPPGRAPHASSGAAARTERHERRRDRQLPGTTRGTATGRCPGHDPAPDPGCGPARRGPGRSGHGRLATVARRQHRTHADQHDQAQRNPGGLPRGHPCHALKVPPACLQKLRPS